MRDVKAKIIEGLTKGQLSKEFAFELIKELQGQVSSGIEIAIIGMAGRLPGARDLGEFWENLKGGVSSIGAFPAERRKDIDPLLSPTDRLKSDPYSPGGYLEQIDRFDPTFFRIPPKEAELMDPYQRLFLLTAVEAIEDAGYGGNQLAETKTGIYVGRNYTDGNFYQKLMTEPNPLAVTGVATSILASRLSYILDLQGPALTIDTACSSSSVAIHLACQALQDRTCELAIAGGISLSMLPIQRVGLGIDSTDGLIRAFDQDAAGTIWGEGVGALLLKPLDQAKRDGDQIWAVIKGSAISNNGRSAGLVAPNPRAISEVITAAWRDAGIVPTQISYIEAHGAGTQLGDPLELQGLSAAFRNYTAKRQFCRVGSVKPNISHLVGASGVASIFKVVLAMKAGLLPATINFTKVNSHFDLENSPLLINDQLTPWETRNAPKLAGVTCLGFNGTNSHIVLEEYQEEAESVGYTSMLKEIADYPLILTLSGYQLAVLRKLIIKYQEFLQLNSQVDLLSLAYTASVGRGHYRYRLAVLFTDLAELREKLVRLLESEELVSDPSRGIYYGYHKLVGYADLAQKGLLTEEQKCKLTAEAEQILVQSKDQSALEELARVYVQGAEVDWSLLYRQQRVKRISLPIYPFAEERFWIESTPEGKSLQQLQSVPIAPLLDELLSTLDGEIYISELSVEKSWVVREHRLLGCPIMPGVGYLEIMGEIGERYRKTGIVRLENVIFVTPLIVPEQGMVQIYNFIQEDGDGFSFTAASKVNLADNFKDQIWEKHALGQIQLIDLPESDQIELVKLRERCALEKVIGAEELNIKDVYEMGPRWRSLEKVYLGEGEALGWIELSEELAGDVQQYLIHPALLDLSLWVGHHLLPDASEYLPLSFKRIDLYHPLPTAFYSYVTLREISADNRETRSFDVQIFDRENRLLIEIEKYLIKKVNQQELASTGELLVRRQQNLQRKRITQVRIKEGEDNSSELERKIAQVWGRALGVEELSLYDDFYSLGGDSIIGITIMTEISNMLKLEIPLEAIFINPTIHALSTAIPDYSAQSKVSFKG